MLQGKNAVYLLTSLLIIWANFSHLQADSGSFARLDSTFKAQAGLSPQAELEEMVFEMRALAREPLELGKIEMHSSTYHLKGDRIGLALIDCQKAVAIFDSLGENELTVLALINEATIQRKLGDREAVDQLEARIMALEPKLPVSKAKCGAWKLRSANAIDHGKMDSAHIWIQPAIEIATQMGDSVMLARSRYVDAVAYQLQGKRKESLQILQEIEAQMRHIPDLDMQIQFFNFFGMAFMSVEQNEDAVRSYEKALGIAQEHGMRWHEGMTLNSLALGLKATGDTLAAIDRHEESLAIALEFNQTANISSICSGLADIYIGLKRWEEAEKYARQGLEYARKAKSQRMEAYALIRIAMVDMHKENYVHALDQLAQADSLTRPSGNWARLKDINEMRADASEQLGEMAEALQYQRMATEAQDSIDYLEAKMYADSLKLSQPVIVQSPLEQDATSAGTPAWIWILVATLAVTLLGGGILFFSRKSKTEASSQERESQEQAKDTTAPSSESISEVIQALKQDKDWTQFMLQFDNIYPGLMANMAQRHPDLTPTDVRILALSRLGLSADETGEVLGISTDSAKKARYRTRKRLGLSSDQSLMQYMLQG